MPIPTGHGTAHVRIGYNNLADPGQYTSTVSVSVAAATGFDQSFLGNWAPYNAWAPSAAGAQWVQYVFAGNQTADYFAVANTNLSTNSGNVVLQYSTNSGGFWNTIATFTPASNRAHWVSFASQSANYWRILATSTPASSIAVAAFGSVYQPYFARDIGFTPPALGRKLLLYTSESDTGLMLGRSILRRSLSSSLTFDGMSTSDAYGEWLTFVKHAEAKPFFLQWSNESWPTDTALMMTDGMIPLPKFSSHELVSSTLVMKGLSL